MRKLRCFTAIGLICAIGIAATAVATSTKASNPALPDDDAAIANGLATLLRAGRTVVSRHQDRLNDPKLGNKSFDSKSMLAEAVTIFQKTTGGDPHAIDANTRYGKLLRMQMDAMAEVVNAHQETLNRKGVGFKGFIPAVFGRLTNEAFGRRAAGIAEVKVTAPTKFIRNPKAKADAWETAVIQDKLLSSAWPKDRQFAEVNQTKGRTAHRTMVPEYYGATCLSCHGSPQGEIDITGYAKEGGHEGELGGAISITLYR